MSDGKFKPGQSGNPGGRPKLDPEMKRLRGLTLDEFKEVASLILSGTRTELAQLIEAGDTPFLREWIARVALQGAQNGDYETLDALLDRLVGKVPAADPEANHPNHGQSEHRMTRDEFAETINAARSEKGKISDANLDVAYAHYCRSILARAGLCI